MLFRRRCFLIFLVSLAASGCSRIAQLEGQIAASAIRAPEGFAYKRVITHLHSPISWDACDSKGFVGRSVNTSCLSHLRNALCEVHVDHAFVTDHPNRMATTEWDDLFLQQAGDEWASAAHTSTILAACSDGFRPEVSVGFEGRLLAFGLTQHLTPPSGVERGDFYAADTRALRDALATEGSALVAVPHTESRTVEHLLELAPDLIEIYNFHAAVDPKIRRASLNAPPFEPMAGLMTFLVDPYGTLNPDYFFLNFLERFDLYFQRWGAVLSQGGAPFGVAGTDAHEYLLSTPVADGERVDSYRRTIRFMSNYVRLSEATPETIADALQQGRSSVVFEGLGVPSGLDFSATVTNGATETVLRSGDQHTLGDGETIQWEIPLPGVTGLTAAEPQPLRQLQLFRLTAAGDWDRIASSEERDLSVSLSEPGIYRAEVSIQPLHLAPRIHPFEAQAQKTFPWIYTNWIQIN